MSIVNVTKAIELTKKLLIAKKVVMLHGSPSSAKSSLAKSIAKEFGLKVIDIRLSQCDPTDLLGMPFIRNDKASYVPMDIFPIEGDEVPEGYTGWCLLLDEMNHASPAVRKAAYKLILDRMVGNHKLHSNVAVIACGNLVTDNTGVTALDPALQTRMCHLHVELDWKEWITWADHNEIDHRITSYINFKPDHLNVFDPKHNDYTYRNPRTWHFLSDIIKPIKDLTFEDLTLIEAAIGTCGAMDFLGYCEIYETLPSPRDIINNPQIEFNNAPNICFALTGTLYSYIDETNIKPLIEFMSRMSIEFQVITMRKIRAGKPQLMKNTVIHEWMVKNVKELI